MARRLVVDPITRIEGHLRIEVEVSDGVVTNAWSSGQMFRGIEMMLKGRDPRDAQHFVQRSCGVCTYVHAVSSVRAVENALGIEIPNNARIIRNLLHGAQYQHDHLVHFYHLHALDWVDIVSALKADPSKTAVLADNSSNAKFGGISYYSKIKSRLRTFVDSGQLGPFSNAYWGHPAYNLPPEANLMACAHYIEALKLQAKAARMHAIFGGKNPHPQSLIVGGVSSVADLTADRISEFLHLTKETQDFIEGVYIPDLMAIAPFYSDWANFGGTSNFLSWGEFPMDKNEPESLYFPRGMISARNLHELELAVEGKVTEEVTRAWYKNSVKSHPHDGVTNPVEANPEYRPDSGKYSWIKAPRYDDKSCEVGPLSRILISYSSGHKEVKSLVDKTIGKLGISISSLFSTLGRTAARALETALIGKNMQKWILELVENIKSGDSKTFEKYEMPREAFGCGLNDVPRGALGHWIRIKDSKISNYQYVVPSTWNFGPRDDSGKLGPVEEALIGTPVADYKRPLEILRTVHSFDPCIACAVHVISPESNKVYKIKVL